MKFDLLTLSRHNNDKFWPVLFYVWAFLNRNSDWWMSQYWNSHLNILPTLYQLEFFFVMRFDICTVNRHTMSHHHSIRTRISLLVFRLNTSKKTEISWPMFFFQLFKLIRNKKMAKNRRNFLPIDLSQQILPLNSNIFFSIEERGKKPQTRKQTFRSNSWLKLINFFLNFYFNDFNLVNTS